MQTSSGLRTTGLPSRLAQLLVGLVLYGFSDGLIVLATLGVASWDVLHQGLEAQTGMSIGNWSIAVGVLVLLAWIPLRQRPGFGTLCNVLVVGLVIDLTISVVPEPLSLPFRWLYLGGGVVLNGFATGCYIGARLGPGPRDGLMTGLVARGHSVRVVRTAIEVTVLAVGWLLGGTVGIGTVVYALAIGPLAHLFLPLLQSRAAPPILEH